MADPKLGNRADELAEFESGGDFQRIAGSCLPEVADFLHVTAKAFGDDVLIEPERVTAEFKRGVAEIQETRDAQLAHDILEHDPEFAMTPVRCDRIEKVSGREREKLIWYGIRASVATAVTGDRILLRQDTLESEHSCKTCQGKGHLEKVCPMCEGQQKPCSHCQVLGFNRDQLYAARHVPCRDCRGSGWRAGIVIPEIAQSKPVSGVVVSVGPETSLTKLGDRVLHSKYAGHALTTPEGETFTIMREPEILCLLKDLAL